MKINFFIPLFISTLATSSLCLASGAAHEGHGLDDHQIKTIIYQTINVSILFAGLFYFLKNPIKSFFKDKKANFILAAEKAQSIKASAEKEHMEIQVRLTKLESTSDESVSRARAEAADMKKQLIAEANSVYSRIRNEAEAAAKLEVEKAKKTLREQLILDATQMAHEQMKTKVSGDDHKRLQGEFIHNIEAVQQ